MLNRLRYDITRRGALSNVKGKDIYADPETFCVYLDVQPLVGEEVEALDRGDRTRDLSVAFDSSKLIQKDDRLDSLGRNYQVIRVQEWPKHNRVIIAKIEETPA